MKPINVALGLILTLMVGGCNAVSRTSPYYEGISDEEYRLREKKHNTAKTVTEHAIITRDNWRAKWPNDYIGYSAFAAAVVLAEKYEAGKLTKAQYIAERAALFTKSEILKSNQDAQREMIELQRESVRSSNAPIICNKSGASTICY